MQELVNKTVDTDDRFAPQLRVDGDSKFLSYDIATKFSNQCTNCGYLLAQSILSLSLWFRQISGRRSYIKSTLMRKAVSRLRLKSACILDLDWKNRILTLCENTNIYDIVTSHSSVYVRNPLAYYANWTAKHQEALILTDKISEFHKYFYTCKKSKWLFPEV